MPIPGQPPNIPPVQQLDHSSVELVSLRQDLKAAGIGSLVAAGVVVMVVLAVLLLGVRLMWVYVVLGYLMVLLMLAPFVMLAWLHMRNLFVRHGHAIHRVKTESALLSLSLDVNMDGKTDEDDLADFLAYLRWLWKGGAPTAKMAAEVFGYSGQQWARYRDILLNLGLAVEVSRSGGRGFEITPAVKNGSYAAIERQVRDVFLRRIDLNMLPGMGRSQVPESPAARLAPPRLPPAQRDTWDVTAKTRGGDPTKSGGVLMAREDQITTLPPDVNAGKLDARRQR